jgi:hypothetical protein
LPNQQTYEVCWLVTPFFSHSTGWAARPQPSRELLCGLGVSATNNADTSTSTYSYCTTYSSSQSSRVVSSRVESRVYWSARSLEAAREESVALCCRCGRRARGNAKVIACSQTVTSSSSRDLVGIWIFKFSAFVLLAPCNSCIKKLLCSSSWGTITNASSEYYGGPCGYGNKQQQS